MIYELFTLFSLPWLFFTDLFLGIIYVSVEKEEGWWAFWATVAFITQFGGFTEGVNFLQVARENAAMILYGIVGYFFVGAVWSVLRWWIFLVPIKRGYDEMRREFLKSYDIGENSDIPDRLREAWRTKIAYTTIAGRRHTFPLRASNHRSTIVMWIAYWPVSASWILMRDPTVYVCQSVYEFLGNAYQNISARVLGQAERDFRR